MTSAHINLDTIKQLKELMAADFQLLVDTFIHDSQKRIVLIEQAIVGCDAELLRTSAHALKGSALNFSAAGLTRLCAELESMGKGGSVEEGAVDLLQALKLEYSQVQACLADV